MANLKEAVKLTAGSVLTVGIAGFIGIFLYKFAQNPDLAWLSGIEPGRALLMVVIVAATVGYGGILLNRAMGVENGKVDEFEKQFRMGREIFLVFTGICGTVVGFYFGTSSQAPSNTAVGVTMTVAADGAIAATLAGGTPPYKVELIKGSVRLPFVANPNDASQFTLAADGKHCPTDYGFEVTGADGKKYAAAAPRLSLPDDHKWKCPEVLAVAGSSSPTPSGQAAPGNGAARQ